ncbi:hypothetical protein B0H19DRAFT_1235480 [Mycena capillaripes]|nr:hypothetical protein B0H19DRAFT_1235480 [Mycena capillaripes]
MYYASYTGLGTSLAQRDDVPWACPSLLDGSPPQGSSFMETSLTGDFNCSYSGGRICIYEFRGQLITFAKGGAVQDGSSSECQMAMKGFTNVSAPSDPPGTTQSDPSATMQSPNQGSSRTASVSSPSPPLKSTPKLSLSSSTTSAFISSGISGMSSGVRFFGIINDTLLCSSQFAYGRQNQSIIGGSSECDSNVPRKSSGPAGKIAGITVGILGLIISIAALLVCIRCRRARARSVREPVFHSELAANRGLILPVAVSEKTGWGIRVTRMVERDTNSVISAQAETRQEYLRNRIRAAQTELSALNDGSASPEDDMEDREDRNRDDSAPPEESNNVLQERIRMLESQLQSQWTLGLSDVPPPGYFENQWAVATNSLVKRLGFQETGIEPDSYRVPDVAKPKSRKNWFFAEIPESLYVIHGLTDLHHAAR